jgi:hypothetical protein
MIKQKTVYSTSKDKNMTFEKSEKKPTHSINHPEIMLQNTIRDNSISRLNDAIDIAVVVLEISGGIRLERFKSDISRIIERLVPIENRIYYGGDPALANNKNKKAEKLFKETKQMLEDLQLDTKAIGKNKRLEEIIKNLKTLKEMMSSPFLLENFIRKILKESLIQKNTLGGFIFSAFNDYHSLIDQNKGMLLGKAGTAGKEQSFDRANSLLDWLNTALDPLHSDSNGTILSGEKAFKESIQTHSELNKFQDINEKDIKIAGIIKFCITQLEPKLLEIYDTLEPQLEKTQEIDKNNNIIHSTITEIYDIIKKNFPVPRRSDTDKMKHRLKHENEIILDILEYMSTPFDDIGRVSDYGNSPLNLEQRYTNIKEQIINILSSWPEEKKQEFVISYNITNNTIFDFEDVLDEIINGLETIVSLIQKNETLMRIDPKLYSQYQKIVQLVSDCRIKIMQNKELDEYLYGYEGKDIVAENRRAKKSIMLNQYIRKIIGEIKK